MNQILGIDETGRNFKLFDVDELVGYDIKCNLDYWTKQVDNGWIIKVVAKSELMLWESVATHDPVEFMEDDCLEVIKWWNDQYISEATFDKTVSQIQFTKWLDELHHLETVRKEADTRGKSILD